VSTGRLASADAPGVSVVVPSRDRELPPELSRALARQTRPAAEIVMVHDAARRGPAWARNQGIDRSRGDCVAFLDDDCVPPDDWLERLVAALHRFDADVVGGTYAETDPLLADRRGRRDYPTEDCVDEAGWVGGGGNILFRRALLERCRDRHGFVFDERFRWSQDWELVIRCRALGARFAFCTVRVRHDKRVGRLAYLKHQFTRGLGIAALHGRIGSEPAASAPHRSLLWSPDGARGGAAKRWLAIVWNRLVGPFDARSFARRGDFAAFWLGEKAKALGFAWGRLRARMQPAPGPREVGGDR